MPKTSPKVYKCRECGTASTPMWRRIQGIKGTFCNACGIRVRRSINMSRAIEKPTQPHSNNNRSAVPLRSSYGRDLSKLIPTVTADNTITATKVAPPSDAEDLWAAAQTLCMLLKLSASRSVADELRANCSSVCH